MPITLPDLPFDYGTVEASGTRHLRNLTRRQSILVDSSRYWSIPACISRFIAAHRRFDSGGKSNESAQNQQTGGSL
ncbi:MAG: hypothetical protein HOK81_13820 [Rhodospirillaceae bacterium]|jgi:hypothetical protein|nr:hypothetical protein [Rhodospirillaceae bacterium]